MTEPLKLPLKIASDEGRGAVEIHDRDDDCLIVIWVEDPFQHDVEKHRAEVIVAALTTDAEDDNRPWNLAAHGNTEYAPDAFTCPMCGSHHFGTDSRDPDSWVVHCHGSRCRWQGPHSRYVSNEHLEPDTEKETTE